MNFNDYEKTCLKWMFESVEKSGMTRKESLISAYGERTVKGLILKNIIEDRGGFIVFTNYGINLQHSYQHPFGTAWHGILESGIGKYKWNCMLMDRIGDDFEPPEVKSVIKCQFCGISVTITPQSPGWNVTDGEIINFK